MKIKLTPIGVESKAIIYHLFILFIIQIKSVTFSGESIIVFITRMFLFQFLGDKLKCEMSKSFKNLRFLFLFAVGSFRSQMASLINGLSGRSSGYHAL